MVKTKFATDPKNPILKEAVKTLYRQDATCVKDTFNILKNSIIELNEDNVEIENIEDKRLASYKNRVTALAKDYVPLFLKKEKVQIIAPSHAD